MKTITQLRTELREAAEHIESLSQELAQLQPDESKKGLDFAHIQTIGNRYPVLDHCLVREDSDFRQQYLTLLAAPLLLESQEPENGWLFFQRILAGIGYTTPLSDFYANAAALTDPQLDAFSAAVVERNLANALLLEAMLLCLSCRGGAAVQDWLAGLAELLGRTLIQVRKLAELAVLISREDSENLRVFTQQEQSIDLSAMSCHIIPILGWYVQFRSGILSYYGDGRTPIHLTEKLPQLFNTNVASSRIEIRNAVFEQAPLTLDVGDRQLLLEDCTIRNIRAADSCFLCYSTHTVVLRRCRFEHLSSNDYTIRISACHSLVLENVHFCDIQSSGYNGWTLCFPSCQMHGVTMEDIRGGSSWYYGAGGTAAPNCYYANCTGSASGLPSGLNEKKEA